MSSSLYRLGRRMASCPWRVIGAWAAILVLLGALAVGLGGRLSEQITIPGTEADDGLQMLSTRFPEMSGASGQFVFVATDGTVDDHREQIQATMSAADEVTGVEVAPDPFAEESPGTRTDDDTAMIGTVQMTGDIGDFPQSALGQLERIAQEHAGHGLEVHAGGQIFTQTTLPVSITEVLGVLFALFVLALTFRAILPAFVPVVTAVIGVAVSMAAVLALAAGVNIPSVTPTLAIMLGLAVGIDYALFILSRHRDQLGEGMDVVESIGRAIATSGSAVIFAGATVIIALVGLFVTGIPFLTLMGLASAFTVGLAVVIALTLLPAILGLLGERIRPRRAKRAEAPARDDDEGDRKGGGFYARWARIVTRVPAVTIILVILVVGALALPAKDLRLSLPDVGTEEKGTPGRDTYDLIAHEFGPGYTSPLLVTADIINSTDPLGVVDDLESRITALPGVEAIQIATPNRTADLAVVVIVPKEGQTSESTAQLVKDLRAHRDGWEKELDVSDITVTGQTAATIDITQKLTDALLPFALFVVGLSLILLTIVFRSLWVPLKASIGYLLSVAAAFGVVTMVFEYGWGNDALNVGIVGPILSFMPIIVMGVLFGLAMDYEVFLVSRMREDYVHTGDARGAVVRGFSASAGVVTAAALIMIAVFASFIPEGSYMIQPIALGLAVGVMVDAFLVRMILVPAVLALLGDRAWHLPGWLDRALPKLDVEGEGLIGVVEHREWTRSHGEAALRLEEAVLPLVDGVGGTLGPLTGAVSPGTLLVVRAADDIARETFLAAAAGRVQPRSGILAVHDSLAPDDLGAIQARVHLISEGDDLPRRLARIGRLPRRRLARELVVIEDLAMLFSQDLGHGASPRELVGQLEDALERGATVILGARSDEPTHEEHELAELLRDPSRHIALAVHRAAPVQGALA